MAKFLTRFSVEFTRLPGFPKTYYYDFVAESVEALEGPIQEFVDEYVNPKNLQVTIEPLNSTGKITSGLHGEFKITPVE